ncbi:MAG: hypothetical protein NTW86_17025 [Candidatus Sumerlaeota bacterium]|nr:hypothetical protein [Candidatus Sumerlaeota bacterium]
MELSPKTIAWVVSAAFWLGGVANAGTAAVEQAAERSTSDTLREIRKLADVPKAVADQLLENDKKIRAAEKAAENSLRRFLDNEKARRYRESYAVLCAGLKQSFARDDTNQAIVNNVRLCQNPPPDPTPQQREEIERVKRLVAEKKLSLDVDDPMLWAYEWTHSTGSCQAVFEATGPYANQFRLAGFTIVRVAMENPDLAVGWVEERIEVPDATELLCISQFLLKPEGGQWRIWGYRAMDGPRLHSWLGKRTCQWPDELAEDTQASK